MEQKCCPDIIHIQGAPTDTFLAFSLKKMTE